MLETITPSMTAEQLERLRADRLDTITAVALVSPKVENVVEEDEDEDEDEEDEDEEDEDEEDEI